MGWLFSPALEVPASNAALGRPLASLSTSPLPHRVQLFLGQGSEGPLVGDIVVAPDDPAILSEQVTPLRQNVTIEQVGNTAAFLCSDLASGITAEVVHVDAGFHAVAFGESQL